MGTQPVFNGFRAVTGAGPAQKVDEAELQLLRWPRASTSGYTAGGGDPGHTAGGPTADSVWAARDGAAGARLPPRWGSVAGRAEARVHNAGEEPEQPDVKAR